MSNKKTNGDDRAYPNTENNSDGLTKRELFAAMFLQGIIGSGDAYDGCLSESAVEYADELIAELNET